MYKEDKEDKMNGEKRREALLVLLQERSEPISANRLAEQFLVTRQIIVADIALLRASGYPIRSDYRGYSLDRERKGLTRRIVVRHAKEDVLDEFYAIVDQGGRVLDVIVEHSVYGRISVELNIASRYDAELFVKRINETGANPLSLLTEGIHIHTVTAGDEQAFERILARLSKLNILIESA